MGPLAEFKSCSFIIAELLHSSVHAVAFSTQLWPPTRKSARRVKRSMVTERGEIWELSGRCVVKAENWLRKVHKWVWLAIASRLEAILFPEGSSTSLPII